MRPLPALAWRWRDARVVFSTAADGDQRDPLRRAAFLAAAGIAAPCAAPRQEHGTVVADARPGETPAADGLVSADRSLALAVFGADCPGLALVARDAVAVAHCGWRGTAAGIVGAAVRRLAGISREPPAAWWALIGPGISAARYEVDAPVLDARAWPAGSVLPGRPGHAFLDLPAAIAADLAAAGVGEIARSGICTAADPRLHSRRRHGAGLAQALVVHRLGDA